MCFKALPANGKIQLRQKIHEFMAPGARKRLRIEINCFQPKFSGLGPEIGRPAKSSTWYECMGGRGVKEKEEREKKKRSSTKKKKGKRPSAPL